MSQKLFDKIIPVERRSDRPVCTIVVDAEEDFDWSRPITGTPFSTSHLRNIPEFERIANAYGAVPTYLLTYPVLNDEDAVKLLRRHSDMGRCFLGVQLHTWVTPPFSDNDQHSRSFATNLDSESQERKLLAIKRRFEEQFGFAPTIFRAGRYGFDDVMTGLLEKHGFLVDTSLAPRTQTAAEGGPDFSSFDYQVFWFGKTRRLLELPLCRSIVGWGGDAAANLYRVLDEEKFAYRHLISGLSRSRCAERITLSPEGNDSAALRRLVRGLRARNQSILSLSFHSSSLSIGLNPYVQTKAELHGFYDRFSGTMDFMASKMNFEFTTPLELYEQLSSESPIQDGSDATC